MRLARRRHRQSRFSRGGEDDTKKSFVPTPTADEAGRTVAATPSAEPSAAQEREGREGVWECGEWWECGHPRGTS